MHTLVSLTEDSDELLRYAMPGVTSRRVMLLGLFSVALKYASVRKLLYQAALYARSLRSSGPCPLPMFGMDRSGLVRDKAEKPP